MEGVIMHKATFAMVRGHNIGVACGLSCDISLFRTCTLFCNAFNPITFTHAEYIITNAHTKGLFFSACRSRVTFHNTSPRRFVRERCIRINSRTLRSSILRREEITCAHGTCARNHNISSRSVPCGQCTLSIQRFSSCYISALHRGIYAR